MNAIRVSRGRALWLALIMGCFAVACGPPGGSSDLVVGPDGRPVKQVKEEALKKFKEGVDKFASNPPAARKAFEDAVGLATGAIGQGNNDVAVTTRDSQTHHQPRGEAIKVVLDDSLAGPRRAWKAVRPYMLNTFIVAGLTALGVVVIGSTTAYVLARHRFFGSKAVFVLMLSTMKFPGVLTLVPSFLLVKKLHLLNTYWAMILPYIAGGQVFAIWF